MRGIRSSSLTIFKRLTTTFYFAGRFHTRRVHVAAVILSLPTIIVDEAFSPDKN
jgi:hypothetical protein